MKKALIIVTLLALMGNAFAQNQGTKEYVSALITFRAESNVPQDSLDKYGVIIQTRSGRMATALIDAEQYQSFLMSNLVERVQPSTRVFLHSNQIKEDGVRIDTPHRQQVKFNEQPDKREDVRHHIIPEEDIRTVREGVSRLQGKDADGNAPPFQAAAQAEDVAVVPVEVHLPGIKMKDGQGIA